MSQKLTMGTYIENFLLFPNFIVSLQYLILKLLSKIPFNESLLFVK
jgi:hypothetical protein